MAISPSMTLTVNSKKEAVTEMMMTISAEGMFNLTASEGSRLKKLDRPKTVQSRRYEIEKELATAERGLDIFSTVAISMAALAVLIVIGFVAFLYWKATGGSLPQVNFEARTEPPAAAAE